MLGPRSSSGAEAETSGILSSADVDLKVPMEFPQGSQASSRVETCKSTLLLSWICSVWLLVELKGLVAFSQGATGLSHLPSCFGLILGVTVESVQGRQMYME